MKITKKTKDDSYEVITVETDEGIFQISYERNLDLYWSYFPKGNITLCDDIKEFTITKEEYFFYNELEKLYNSVKNCTPYSNYPYECDDKAEIVPYNNGLFKDGIISWYSDDFDMENASVLNIKKNDNETFTVSFKKSIDDGLFITFTVRMRNSGSRYHEYNTPFMSMFHNLCMQEYGMNHQIHMEEYLFAQKRILGKK